MVEYELPELVEANHVAHDFLDALRVRDEAAAERLAEPSLATRLGGAGQVARGYVEQSAIDPADWPRVGIVPAALLLADGRVAFRTGVASEGETGPVTLHLRIQSGFVLTKTSDGWKISGDLGNSPMRALRSATRVELPFAGPLQ